MAQPLELHVNGRTVAVEVDPATPLVYVLRNDLGLKSPKVGCNQEQCYACAVLVDGAAVPSCQLPVQQVAGLEITTVEGLGDAAAPHPLQEAFIAEQAIQCGYCASGMIIAAQGLLRRNRYPSDDEIRAALSDNICRCGVYDRVRRAIRLRIGRPSAGPIYTVLTPDPLPPEWTPPPRTGLSPSLRANPQLDNWIRIDPGDDNGMGTVTVFTGKVEIGQGLRTAIAQIAAEELDVELARIRVVDGDTAQTPDEGITAGSQSMETSGTAVRQAAADARHHLLALAHEALEATGPRDALTVDDGVVTDPVSGRQVDYWTLFGGQRFGVDVTGVGQPKPPAQYRVVGQAARRLDLPAKVSGVPSYVQDLELPHMVHGRVVRPPSYLARLAHVDTEPVAAMDGVLQVVHDGSFLAVIAAREEQAIAAAEELARRAHWDDAPPFPAQDAIFEHLTTAPARSFLIEDGTAVETEIPPRQHASDAATTLHARYERPFQMHASLGPSAAVAHFVDGTLTVWAQTQGVFPQRTAIAHVLGLAEDAVHVIHVEGAGCYGHNGAEDAALDAALLARALPGRPVALKWMRADEHRWEPYAPAMVMELQADLDARGAIAAWNHDVWSHSHVTRPRPGASDESGLLAAWHLADPFTPQAPRTVPGRHFGEYRNADPIYDLPLKRVASHFVEESPLRTSAFRSLGAYANIFAIESFMDELAYAAGVDPVEFRLRHVRDPRVRAVMEAAATAADWQPHTAPVGTGTGWGFAFAQYKNIQCYTAVVVDATVDPATGAIQLQRAVIAADAGLVVNPDGLSNQLEGGFLQAASMTLCEEVDFDQGGIRSRDWDTYPILRFAGAPVIETVLLNRPTLPFLGSGEASIGPTPAAIANAVFHATGLRLRRIPFTPARVQAAATHA
ncbi:MAG: molybdopterin-dependent oxidoreductase [Caldilineaceae bacterium]|nr:molybdopterin-dependent oxidoreductase [Caldilineaceae bacterium]